MAKYERIADDLRASIRDGKIAPGERLPPETDLTAQFRVSLPTLREPLCHRSAPWPAVRPRPCSLFRNPKQ